MQTSSEISREIRYEPGSSGASSHDLPDSVVDGVTADRAEIVPLLPHHAPAAARLHIAGQPGTFLTSLGLEILTVVYRALPQSQSGFGFVAQTRDTPVPETPALEDNTVLGFVSATTSTGRLFAQVGRQEFAALVPLLLARCVRRPKLLWQAAQTLVYPLRAHVSPSESAETGQPIELLSIMVEPSARSQGIGGRLLDTLVDASIRQGAAALDVTVDVENAGAQRFYMRHGFSRIRQFTLYGRQMALYRKQLS